MSDRQKKASKKLKGLDGKLLVAAYVLMDYAEFKKVLASKKGTALEMMIMRVVERGIAKADIQILVWVYDILGLVEGMDDQAIKVSYNIIQKEISKL